MATLRYIQRGDTLVASANSAAKANSVCLRVRTWPKFLTLSATKIGLRQEYVRYSIGIYVVYAWV